MDRCVCIKIAPNVAQIAQLQALAAHFAAVCGFVASVAQAQKIKKRFELHHAAYYGARHHSQAAAQIAVLAIKQVAASYKQLSTAGALHADKLWPALALNARGAIPFDARTYRIKGDGFSLYTLEGRMTVPWVLGKRQKAMLKRGTPQEARLVNKRGKWFMHVAIRQNSPKAAQGSDVLGLDVGEVNIAATSSGMVFKANRLRHDRDKFESRRARLQRNGSQSAKQALKKASGREARHVKHINHVTSKRIVAEALTQGASAIAMEDLTHIRLRIKAGKRMRARLHRWPWRQLQDFVAYKAEQAGIAVAYIDPAYTSKTCAQCFCLGQRHRSYFKCSCGSQRHADVNAASNIRRLALPIDGATPYVTAGHVAFSPPDL